MEAQDITVEKRTETGKGAAHRLRRAGRIPGNLYGPKQEAVSIALDPKEFMKCVRDSGNGRNTLFTLGGLDRPVRVLAQELQFHPLKRHLMHVDFIEVTDDVEVTVNVPLRYVGRPVGVTGGGSLEDKKREVRLVCKATRIPKEIVLEIKSMEIGDQLLLGDLDLPEGARPAHDPKERLATIRPPKVAAEPGAGEAGAAAPAE